MNTMQTSAVHPVGPPPPQSLRGRLTARGMFIQTAAMFVDAYRELNAKKLFWITMILSAVVVAAFAAVGFDASGFSIFGKHFHHEFINSTFIPKQQLYENLFIELGVNWWLGFIAIILALISTAPIFPDFLSGGAVDLYLARPLGRLRLFVTKYVVGLLFVSMQVAAFCVASLLVIGVRGGVWVPGIFLAIPVVVLMFSYLWAICALVGTITRSTIAALLLTTLAWIGIFGVHSAESILLTFSVGKHVERDLLDRDIDRFTREIAELEATPAATQPRSFSSARLFTLRTSLDATRADRANWHDDFAAWHTGLYLLKWPLPKTSETTALLNRWLDRQFRDGRPVRDVEETDEAQNRSFFADRRVQRLTGVEVDKIVRSRSEVWVIGTSLLFEAATVGLAAWIFARRDF